MAYEHRRECTHSTMFQSSPAKARLDLNEARREHRSRIKSIENVRTRALNSEFERLTKDRIYRDLYELECSWNEFQYQKQREVLSSEQPQHERSLTRHRRTHERENSPEGFSMQHHRVTPNPACQETKALHRTKISLVGESKRNLLLNRQQHESPSQDVRSQKSSMKRLPKSVIQTPPPPKKSSGYIQKIFNNCLASRNLETTPKLRSKPTRQQAATTVRKPKQSAKICSPSPRHKLSQESTLQETPVALPVKSCTT